MEKKKEKKKHTTSSSGINTCRKREREREREREEGTVESNLFLLPPPFSAFLFLEVLPFLPLLLLSLFLAIRECEKKLWGRREDLERKQGYVAVHIDTQSISEFIQLYFAFLFAKNGLKGSHLIFM